MSYFNKYLKYKQQNYHVEFYILNIYKKITLFRSHFKWILHSHSFKDTILMYYKADVFTNTSTVVSKNNHRKSKT